LDTAADNFPPLITGELIPPVLAIFEQTHFMQGYGIFNVGMNMRLNTTNLTIPELDAVLFERNLTWGDMYAMVE